VSMSYPNSNSNPTDRNNNNNNNSSNDESDLQRLQEENFDLQATIATLQAEKQFEISTLQKTAASNESKWKAELRLAQQEALRWKSRAQQGSRPKSIVSSATPKMPQQASQAALLQSASAGHNNAEMAVDGDGDFTLVESIRTKANDLEQHYETTNAPDLSGSFVPKSSPASLSGSKSMDSKPSQIFHAMNDAENDTGFTPLVENPPTKRRTTLPAPPPITTAFHPTSHLASNLLTRTAQETAETASPEFMQQDSYVRQVLIGIACGSASKAETISMKLVATTTDSWSEEDLIDWLIRHQTPILSVSSPGTVNSDNHIEDGQDTGANDSKPTVASVSAPFSPSDKYWSLALVVSSAARQHVIRQVLQEATKVTSQEPNDDDSKMEVDPENLAQLSLSTCHRNGRKFRIQPLGDNRDQDLFYARLGAAKKALRSPFWEPSASIPYLPKTKKQSAAFDSSLSAKPFRQFIRLLAESCYIPHLRSLQVILEEASCGLEDTNANATMVWWELCYGPISKTIQRIVYSKITALSTEKKEENGKQQRPGSRGGTRPPHRPSSRGSDSGKSKDGRRRIRNITARLQSLRNLPIADESLETSTDGNSYSINDDILEDALGVLLGLLRVMPIEKLESWYEDLNGWEKPEGFSSPPGGLVLVSMLLDLMEYLLFVEWKNENSPMHPKHVLTAGSLCSDSNRRPAATAIPRYYLVGIAILQLVGRTRGGMKVLRTRMIDNHDFDMMGNALDVSIWHLEALAWHWGNHKNMEGAVQRFDDEKPGKVCHVCQQERSALVEAVESWIRLWHQVLLFVQQSCHSQDISFRSLIVDLQDHYTSACAMLLSAEDVRSEIKTMIRWHLEELAFDEEEYLEAKEEKQEK
jgi:hypothetical protein